MGTLLGPDVLAACRALYDDEQAGLASRGVPLATDLAYGPDNRNRLDLYGEGRGGKPILLFVHGGGFTAGDKGGEGNWPNAAVGRMAAERGFLGAVMNYRLAPDHPWPAGSEDVAAAVDWLRTNAADHGGDPAQIVLCGTSAGAVHVAGYVKLAGADRGGVRGAVLLSGLYGYSPLDPKDARYYPDPGAYRDQMPGPAVVETELPLLVACAEFDPPRFQAEFLGLLGARLARHGALPRVHYANGHNHYSIAMHLGTSDRRLADEIADFVNTVTNRGSR
jgi:acetyl esterase/lipase